MLSTAKYLSRRYHPKEPDKLASMSETCPYYNSTAWKAVQPRSASNKWTDKHKEVGKEEADLQHACASLSCNLVAWPPGFAEGG